MSKSDLSLTRRKFVAGAAAAGAVAVGLASCSTEGSSSSSSAQEASTSAAEESSTAVETASLTGKGDPFADCDICYASCAPECQHHVLKGYVRDGKLVKVESAEVNESPACARGLARVELNNREDRLKMPLLRSGEKGSGEFEEISWEDAFDLIGEKVSAAIEEYGNESLVYDRGSGNFQSLSRDLPSALISWMGGGNACTGNTCCAGIDAAVATILGKRVQPNRNEFPNAKYIIAWGNNPVVSLTGYFSRFQEMMDKGGTLCTIDPFLSETVDKSQEWLRPWPGSDSALALGMLKVIIDEGLTNEEYLLAHTTAPCLIDKTTDAPFFADTEDDTTYQVYDPETNEIVAHDAEGVTPLLSVADTVIADQYVTIYDLIKAEADKWGKDEVEAETGCSYDDIARIARAYATSGASIIIQNMGGYQRTENGAYATATQVYLALFTGNIGHTGDGVYDVGGVSTIDGLSVNPAFESNPDAAICPGIPRVHFGEYVLEDNPVPIQCAFFFCTDAAAQWPNSGMVKKGLEKIPFVVTCDQFMTTTALYSDLILPVTSVFETDNVCANSRSSVLGLCEAGVTPPGEAKSDLEIAAGIGERLGFADKFNKEPKEYIATVIEPLGITYEELAEKKAIDCWDMVPGWIAYKDANFFTTTGKAHLWVQKWVDEGYPGIACHQRPEEHYLNASTYPLAAIQQKTRHQVHTTFNNLETMLDMDGHQPRITIHPDDAAERGIENGDTVIAFNDRGEHEGIAYVTDHVKQGCVMLQNGWNEVTSKGSSSNVTNNKYPTLGTMHCCNSTLVDVRKGA